MKSNQTNQEAPLTADAVYCVCHTESPEHISTEYKAFETIRNKFDMEF